MASPTTIRRRLHGDGVYYSPRRQEWVWVGGPQGSLHLLGSLHDAHSRWLSHEVGDSSYDIGALDGAIHAAARCDRHRYR